MQQIIKNELSSQTQEILKLAKSTDKVLEIGIGSGQTSLCLARLGCETYALDNEQKCLDLALEVAKELKINLNAMHHDALKPLPFKEKEFDIIFHAGLMEHFPKEERINMLKLWRPYCKKMISIIPNGNSLAYRIGKALMQQNGTWAYGLELSIYTQIDELIEAGYKFEQEYTIGAQEALSFLPKKHFMRKALKKWLETNICGDDCRQGNLLVSIGTNE
ncbi:class I SAM-dependent methyltransferase [Campylobacter sp. MIT 97-5078]|uniref:class I SAM-dependent methyltransferase n=1 Tax=Campylobacter sp. MIT 97-5078 TaxID=1548153 RepID=UPI00068C21DD|nr:class I SAM-dependent methyltransferase [Campylobacter sp. MIT 97-5078]